MTMHDSRARRARTNVGLDRKALGIVLLGVTWISVSIGVLDERHGNLWHQLISDDIRQLLWWGAGGLAIISAWSIRVRPWAMAMLVIAPGLRMFSYISAWIVYLIPDGNPGYSLGWAFAMTYACMIAFVFYIADDDGRVETINELSEALRKDPEGTQEDAGD